MEINNADENLSGTEHNDPVEDQLEALKAQVAEK